MLEVNSPRDFFLASHWPRQQSFSEYCLVHFLCFYKHICRYVFLLARMPDKIVELVSGNVSALKMLNFFFFTACLRISER